MRNYEMYKELKKEKKKVRSNAKPIAYRNKRRRDVFNLQK